MLPHSGLRPQIIAESAESNGHGTMFSDPLFWTRPGSSGPHRVVEWHRPALATAAALLQWQCFMFRPSPKLETSGKKFCLTLRVQVPNNHMLTQNHYYDSYYPDPKYLIIGYMDPRP